jgi:hydroxylamine reductase
VYAFFYEGLVAIGAQHSVPELLDLNMKFGPVNLKCMLFSTTRIPASTELRPHQSLDERRAGPFIVVRGMSPRSRAFSADGRQGVNVYTHGECFRAMLSRAEKHPQLKGNFGTAWQNQQKDSTVFPPPSSSPRIA